MRKFTALAKGHHQELIVGALATPAPHIVQIMLTEPSTVAVPGVAALTSLTRCDLEGFAGTMQLDLKAMQGLPNLDHLCLTGGTLSTCMPMGAWQVFMLPIARRLFWQTQQMP